MAQAEVESLGARPACAPRAHPPSPRDPLARESVKSALGVLILSSSGLPTAMVTINFQWPTASTGCRGLLTWRALSRLAHGASFAERVLDLVRVHPQRMSMWVLSRSLSVFALTVRSMRADLRHACCFTMCSKHPYDCKPKVTESGSPFLAMLVFASSSKPGGGGAADMSGFIFAGEIVVAYS